MNRAFAGKVVLITGASSGIGAALARELARRGAAVALVARRLERLSGLAGEIADSGGRALALSGDVTADGDLERAVAATLEAFGRLDIAVANAGFGVAGRFGRLTLEDWRRQMETNLFGVLRTAYATLPELQRSRGTLAIVGSVAGHLPGPRTSAYATSKYAVRGLAESLRVELAGDGVAVVLITPGFVSSEIRMVDNAGVMHPELPDPVPAWLVMPAERAARQIASAIARRRREAVITLHGKLAVFLARHAPWLVSSAAGRVRRRPRHESWTE